MNLLMLWSLCIQSCNLFQQLNNMLMVINHNQIFPHLHPPNRHQTCDLLHQGWCYQHTSHVVQLRESYHLLEFPAMFNKSMKGNLASSEEAFILTMVKLATGKTNIDLADLLAFCSDAIVSMIY